MNYFRYLTRSPVTASFFLICVVVALLTSLGSDKENIAPFLISVYQNAPLPEIRQGQIWRLFTPMFLHFSILHIVFNMMWLIDLGVVIEQRHGSFRLFTLIMLIALFSNLGEYLWTFYPMFGGMSGVVYGLLGYLWVFGKLNPRSELQLNPQVVYLMLIWFVLCWTGLLGSIANMAHTVGLLMGVIFAWLFSPNKDLRRIG